MEIKALAAFDTSSCYLLNYYIENTVPKRVSFQAYKRSVRLEKQVFNSHLTEGDTEVLRGEGTD